MDTESMGSNRAFPTPFVPKSMFFPAPELAVLEPEQASVAWQQASVAWPQPLVATTSVIFPPP